MTHWLNSLVGLFLIFSMRGAPLAHASGSSGPSQLLTAQEREFLKVAQLYFIQSSRENLYYLALWSECLSDERLDATWLKHLSAAGLQTGNQASRPPSVPIAERRSQKELLALCDGEISQRLIPNTDPQLVYQMQLNLALSQTLPVLAGMAAETPLTLENPETVLSYIKIKHVYGDVFKPQHLPLELQSQVLQRLALYQEEAQVAFNESLSSSEESLVLASQTSKESEQRLLLQQHLKQKAQEHQQIYDQIIESNPLLLLLDRPIDLTSFSARNTLAQRMRKYHSGGRAFFDQEIMQNKNPSDPELLNLMASHRIIQLAVGADPDNRSALIEPLQKKHSQMLTQASVLELGAWVAAGITCGMATGAAMGAMIKNGNLPQALQLLQYGQLTQVGATLGIPTAVLATCSLGLGVGANYYFLQSEILKDKLTRGVLGSLEGERLLYDLSDLKSSQFDYVMNFLMLFVGTGAAEFSRQLKQVIKTARVAGVSL